MNIVIGADHAGFAMKEDIKQLLSSMGHSLIDVGTTSADRSVDYPDIARSLAKCITSGGAERGVLICGTGIGMSVAANKVPGIYAALCTNEYMARMSRQHNGSNVLVMGSRVIGSDLAHEITRAWLATEPEGGRHAGRRGKIADIEREARCSAEHTESK